MLVSLHVKNLKLIQETEVFFGPGLNILSGETGAGKSIIIGSVGLALGEKADRDMIRTGSDYALIELIFQIRSTVQEERIRQMDIPVEEDGMVILSRRIMPQRSVCKINGETVNARTLKELAGILIDIHGQHDSQKLLLSRKHLEILDDFAAGALSGIKSGLKENYHIYMQLKNEWESLDTDVRSRDRLLSLAAFEAEEIDRAQLKRGEDEELEHRYRLMNNSRRIAETLGTVHLLTGCEEEGGAGYATGRAFRELSSITAFDTALQDMAGMLGDADSLLSDFNRALTDYMSDLEFDQEDFVRTEERLNQINHLKEKYGKSIDDILAYREEKQAEINRLNDSESYRKELTGKMEACGQKLDRLCEQVSKARKKAGADLSARLTEALKDLNFNHVDFAVQIEQKDTWGQDGWDDVTFMISTNPGMEKRPLADIASGGELSRIMLGLKTVTAKQEDTDTFIFDEIDAGISGKTAWQVSRKLAVLGSHRQVICITHLPQIAAMADNHFIIEKRSDADSTTTDIKEINGDRLLEELARMLGSDVITPAGLANARELKEMAANTKQY